MSAAPCPPPPDVEDIVHRLNNMDVDSEDYIR